MLDKSTAFTMGNTKDKAWLRYNDELNQKQKLAHYRTPDYCIVTKAETLGLLLLELESLTEDEGVFYNLYCHVKHESDFDKKDFNADDLISVVIFFDDPKIDHMAEKLKVETRLK